MKWRFLVAGALVASILLAECLVVAGKKGKKDKDRSSKSDEYWYGDDEEDWDSDQREMEDTSGDDAGWGDRRRFRYGDDEEEWDFDQREMEDTSGDDAGWGDRRRFRDNGKKGKNKNSEEESEIKDSDENEDFGNDEYRPSLNRRITPSRYEDVWDEIRNFRSGAKEKKGKEGKKKKKSKDVDEEYTPDTNGEEIYDDPAVETGDNVEYFQAPLFRSLPVAVDEEEPTDTYLKNEDMGEDEPYVPQYSRLSRNKQNGRQRYQQISSRDHQRRKQSDRRAPSSRYRRTGSSRSSNSGTSRQYSRYW